MDTPTSPLRARLRGSRGWEALVLAKALAVGGERREAAVARLVRPANLFQPYTTTGTDRYPVEFGILRDELTTETPAILSFGCSSGEELLTLHHYFPGARITGIDANPLAVRTARKRVRAAAPGADITVLKGSDASTVEPASYDVVLALAVFRHGALSAAPRSCAELIRFADFERTVTGLAAGVRPGGFLVLRHANFRFTDCAAARDFVLVRGGFASAGAGGAPSPVYGPDDRLLADAARDDGIYRRS